MNRDVSSEVWEELIQCLALSSVSVYHPFQRKIMIKIQLVSGNPLAARIQIRHHCTLCFSLDTSLLRIGKAWEKAVKLAATM